MKKQKTKLMFTKKTVTELTDMEIKGVNGGCQYSDSSGFTLTTKTSIVIPTIESITNTSTINTLNPFTN